MTTTAVAGAGATATTPSVTTNAAARTAARGLRRIPKKWAIAGGATATVAVAVIAAVALTGGSTSPDLAGKWKIGFTVTDPISGGGRAGTKTKVLWDVTCTAGDCSTPTPWYGHKTLHLTQQGSRYTGTYSSIQTCPAHNGMPVVHGVGRIDDRFELTAASGGSSTRVFRGTDTVSITLLKPSTCTVPADRHGVETVVGNRIGSS